MKLSEERLVFREVPYIKAPTEGGTQLYTAWEVGELMIVEM